jgi:GT2 family glycosyltransferase
MNISLLVALKNNLDYNKHFYKTTRELYPEVEICFSSFGSTDGTNEWLDSLSNDPFTKTFHSNEYGCFSDNFNKAMSLATKDYVAYLHNDIVLAPGFIENLEKHTGPNNVVAYTTIEPPIFAGHERPGKLIKDLGIDLKTFSLKKLYDFVAKEQIKYKDKTEEGVAFFMCMPREVLVKMGGLDNLFNPMFCEDDDLVLRFKYAGMNMFTSLDAMCYHFVSKTSRFSDEYKENTRKIEIRSNRNFVRKWGNVMLNFTAKYNIGFVMNDCYEKALNILEPWADRVYITDPKIKESYIKKEQVNTKYDLDKRVLISGINDPYKENDIVIEFDVDKLDQNQSLILSKIAAIIQESGEIGEFEVGIFKITINKLETYEHNLINL